MPFACPCPDAVPHWHTAPSTRRSTLRRPGARAATSIYPGQGTDRRPIRPRNPPRRHPRVGPTGALRGSVPRRGSPLAHTSPVALSCTTTTGSARGGLDLPGGGDGPSLFPTHEPAAPLARAQGRLAPFACPCPSAIAHWHTHPPGGGLAPRRLGARSATATYPGEGTARRPIRRRDPPRRCAARRADGRPSRVRAPTRPPIGARTHREASSHHADRERAPRPRPTRGRGRPVARSDPRTRRAAAPPRGPTGALRASAPAHPPRSAPPTHLPAGAPHDDRERAARRASSPWTACAGRATATTATFRRGAVSTERFPEFVAGE